jgi:hypothetical protein
MTIKEAKNDLEKYNNELELYLEKKQINFERTQPQAVKFKDVILSTGFVNDKFLHYVIKDKDLDSTIYYLQKKINATERYIIKEMERISNNKGSEYLVYLRDEMKLSWDKISRYTNYSLRQCHRLYNQAKQK